MTTMAYPSANSTQAHGQLGSLSGSNEGVIGGTGGGGTTSQKIDFVTGYNSVINKVSGLATGNQVGANS
jgi:hypothetical protein